MTRTFIALELKETLQRFLGDIISQAAQELPNLRWVNPAGIHLTMFGSSSQPRVIWMGVEDLPSGQIQGSPLQQLHRVLTRELELRGFEIEKRPFSPHLTLARIKQPLAPDEQQRLQRLLHSKKAGASSPLYRVDHLSVMKSELSRTGATYTCLLACSFSTVNRLA